MWKRLVANRQDFEGGVYQNDMRGTGASEHHSREFTVTLRYFGERLYTGNSTRRFLFESSIRLSFYKRYRLCIHQDGRLVQLCIGQSHIWACKPYGLRL